MAKVTRHSVPSAFRGKFGDIVFKNINGEVYASLRAESKKPRTENQLAWNKKFKLASEFAKSVKHDPELLAFYAPIAKSRGCRIREVILSDAFQGPKIESVDLSGYSGQPGSFITIRATDNFGVARVQVTLLRENGTGERGLAISEGETWRYVATAAMPSGGPVTIGVEARDRPGNCATANVVWPPSTAPASAAPSA